MEDNLIVDLYWQRNEHAISETGCDRKYSLIPVDDEIHKEVFCSIVDGAFRKIYANHRFDEMEISWIGSVRVMK